MVRKQPSATKHEMSPKWAVLLTGQPAELEQTANNVTSTLQSFTGSDAAGSQQLFKDLAVLELNTVLSKLDPADSSLQPVQALTAVVHNVNDGRFSQLLCSQGTVAALLRLHKRCTNLDFPLPHQIVALLWLMASQTLHQAARSAPSSTAPTTVAAVSAEDSSAWAAKTELVEALITHLVWLSMTPASLFTQQGLCTSALAVKLLWELVRHQSAACRAALAMVTSADVPRRLLALTGYSFSEHTTSLTAPDLTTLAAAYVDVLCSAMTFTTALLGLGSATDLTATSLASMRGWMLRSGNLEAFKAPLLQLVEVIGPADHTALATAVATSDKASSLRSGARTSLRNALMFLLVPTVVRGSSAADIAAGVTFVIEYCVSLSEQGYLPVLHMLYAATGPLVRPGQDASAAASTATAGTPAAAGLFDGGGAGHPLDPFLAAAAQHLLELVPGVSAPLAERGVTFDRKAGLADAPGLALAAGFDGTDEAQKVVQSLLQPIVNYGQAVLREVLPLSQAVQVAAVKAPGL